MKKYWIIPAAVVVVTGTTLLLVFSQDKKDTASGSPETVAVTKVVNKNTVDKAADAANPKVSEGTIPAQQTSANQNDKAEEALNEIKRMYKPEWERVNQIADQRLTELVAQAQKEYKAKKENNMDVSRIEGKYLGILQDYEESTKTLVDNIISNMQKDVIEKNLQTNIGDEYFELYKIQKEKRTEKVVTELKKLS
jgi:hypothetical protein